MVAFPGTMVPGNAAKNATFGLFPHGVCEVLLIRAFGDALKQ
jgi:hypothetical protein